MTWPDIFGFDADGEPTEWGLLHCCCDGYAPPAGGRPLTPSDFAADAHTWGGD